MENQRIPDKQYKQILEHIAIPCVDIVACHNGKVLLVKRTNEPAKDLWWVPGGRINKRETVEQAALRKLKQETGLTGKIEKKVGFYDTIFDKGPFPDLKTGIHTVNVVFLVSILEENPEINLDRTSEEYKWVDKIEEDYHPYIKQILKDSGIFE